MDAYYKNEDYDLIDPEPGMLPEACPPEEYLMKFPRGLEDGRPGTYFYRQKK